MCVHVHILVHVYLQGSNSGGTGGSGRSEYTKLLKLCRFLSSLLVKLVQVRDVCVCVCLCVMTD